MLVQKCSIKRGLARCFTTGEVFKHGLDARPYRILLQRKYHCLVVSLNLVHVALNTVFFGFFFCSRVFLVNIFVGLLLSVRD